VAKNRYVIGKIGIDNLFVAQSEKDAALQAYIQSLRAYWTGYFRLRKLTLHDFATGREIT
jgi:outer membrane protein TolC